jgi:hypothetical protein
MQITKDIYFRMILIILNILKKLIVNMLFALIPYDKFWNRIRRHFKKNKKTKLKPKRN